MAHSRIAEHLEDEASRLDAGLHTESHPGEAPVAALRRRFSLAPWEWATLTAAETAGTLPAVLRVLAGSRRDRAQLRNELLGGLAYPALVLTMCGFVGGLVLATGAAPTGWLVTTVALFVLAVAAAGWLTWRLRDPGFDGDRLPLVGRLSRCAGELPYLVALRVLYGAGMGLRRAHPEAANAARVPWVRARLFLATSELEAGEGLATALAKHGALTAESLTLVRNGEAAGQLEDALGRAASRRQDEYVRALRRAARILGGVTYAYAAFSVLWIALSFYGSYYGRL